MRAALGMFLLKIAISPRNFSAPVGERGESQEGGGNVSLSLKAVNRRQTCA
jgi:hypothetical protein